MPGAKVPLEPWPVDQPFPALMTDEQLMRVVQLRPAAFYLHKKRGAFRRLEAQGVTVGSTRYSGQLVKACANREPLSQFGKRKSTKTLQ